MGDIFNSVCKTLVWIVTGVPVAIKNEISSSHKSRSVEEQVVDKIKRQSSTIQNLQDWVTYHLRNVRDLRYENNELKDFIEKLVKENQTLKNRVRSLERENFDLRSRSKRSR